MNNNEELEEIKRLTRRHWYLKKKQDPVWWAKKQAANRKGYLAKIEKQAKLLAMKPAKLTDAFKLQNMAQIKPEFKPQSFIDTPHLLPESLLKGLELYKRDKRSPMKDSHLNINKYGRCIINKGAIEKYGLSIYKTCNFYVKNSRTIGLLLSTDSKGELKIYWHKNTQSYTFFQIGRAFIGEKKIEGRFQIIATNHTITGDLEVLLEKKEEKDNEK